MAEAREAIITLKSSKYLGTSQMNGKVLEITASNTKNYLLCLINKVYGKKKVPSDQKK